MLIVVFQVVDLLEHLVVRMSCLLYVRYQGLMLEVESPVLFVVVYFVALEDWLLLESDGS